MLSTLTHLVSLLKSSALAQTAGGVVAQVTEVQTHWFSADTTRPVLRFVKRPIAPIILPDPTPVPASVDATGATATQPPVDGTTINPQATTNTIGVTAVPDPALVSATSPGFEVVSQFYVADQWKDTTVFSLVPGFEITQIKAAILDSLDNEDAAHALNISYVEGFDGN